MAEYVEVMKQKKRMCNSTLCCKCNIFHFAGEDIGNCQQFISNNPSKAEEIIMSWAAEHPEPQFPTWKEWLEEQRVVVHFDSVNNKGTKVKWELTNKSNCPIPADIAEKLGIEPKGES